MAMATRALKIHIRGLVQGVGFRPFIYRLALQNGLSGWVENRNDGVLVQAEGLEKQLMAFLHGIQAQAPEAANISSIDTHDASPENSGDFQIRMSENRSDEITDVSPDIAVCQHCLEDLHKQAHRIDFPFINCTNCGPRFTIIRDLPYDREKTTMEPFKMCKRCKAEYENVLDRRFHAQPVACNECGPAYQIHQNGKLSRNLKEILLSAKEILEGGGIIALKGMGGFHLACDARNQDAVSRLRVAKNRDGKPFAVMFSDLETIKEYLDIDEVEEAKLVSWRRPIMILKNKADGKKLAQDVSVGFETTGAMLPYMPFHHLLFRQLDLPVIVLTSGNIADEPIIIDDDTALEQLSSFTDAVITYNRGIHNRTDDSVGFATNGKQRIIRRSRGYVPAPVNLQINVDNLFAAGAELVASFCVGKGRQAIMSQHIGDLKNIETLDFYTESVARFKNLFRVDPQVYIHDLHPDYLSTRYAKDQGMPTIAVQHHHAHIASCMGEHGIDEKVIGISFDGVGLGTDYHIWGGEFLIADLAGFERYNHFEYIPQPGGDLATENPWRMALAYLYTFFGQDCIKLDIPFIRKIKSENLELLTRSIELGLNAPLSSSAGRLFDSVSALLGLCHESSFHAEAPMRLEALTRSGINDHYTFNAGKVVSFREMFEEIIKDIQANIPPWLISTKFHNTVINVIFAMSDRIRKDTGISKAVLSGGTFQNRYLLKGSEEYLESKGFKVYAQQRVPSNDGGIALGQLLIGAKQIESGLHES
jgi:hydrogenase maturation protein HypF